MTYSIVARDPDTGEMGVATQSQAFAVGSSVPFALPGHGVIATQSMAEPMYGSVGLDLLQGGFTALRPMDPVTEPDQLMWRAVVAALAGREDAAREMLGELAISAPQFLEAARRFGKAGLMPADVVERIVPAAP